MILLLWLWQWLVSECILCSSSPKLFWFPSFSQAFFLSSLNLILDHLWKSEFWELTGNPWVMGTFFPFSPIPILPRRKHIQCAEWEVPSCWTPRTPSNFPHSPPPTLLDQMPFSLDSHTLLFFPSLPLFPLFSCRMWGCLLHDLYRENQLKVIPNPPLLYLSHHTSYILSLILNYRMHI